MERTSHSRGTFDIRNVRGLGEGAGTQASVTGHRLGVAERAQHRIASNHAKARREGFQLSGGAVFLALEVIDRSAAILDGVEGTVLGLAVYGSAGVYQWGWLAVHVEVWDPVVALVLLDFARGARGSHGITVGHGKVEGIATDNVVHVCRDLTRIHNWVGSGMHG